MLFRSEALTAPVGQLYYLRPAEAFMVYLKIALLAGLILAAPMVLYQLYSFVRPALTLREKHYALCTIPIIIVLFLGGMLFSYYLVFPRAVEFFLGFGNGHVNPLISMESYLDFLLMLVVPFGFVFNIPVVLLLLAYLKLLPVNALGRYHKHVILAAFILAAFITDANRIEETPITHRPLDGHHRLREEDEFIFENEPSPDDDDEFAEVEDDGFDAEYDWDDDDDDHESPEDLADRKSTRLNSSHPK